MDILTNAPKGTNDRVPAEMVKWEYVENICESVAKAYGYGEISSPTFEHTELFCRSVGEGTDVVQKEMFTFTDKGNRSVTLRPEGTAGVVRAAIENGLLNEAFPVKLYYFANCFRHEKNQAGRSREFHQFGIEVFGSNSPATDAEVITLASSIIDKLGIKNIKLQINSIGCKECRGKYLDALKEYYKPHLESMCGTCGIRYNKNPMRLIDCKNDNCIEISKNVPKITDFICGDCKSHFDEVKNYLDLFSVKYEVNHKIVRGLDYYNKTVFEFISDCIGAQSAMGAGGRYDGLVKEIGGADVPGVGLAMGLERIILTMEAQNITFPAPPKCRLYIASLGENALRFAALTAEKLRNEGVTAEFDTMGRSLKAQMKYAGKIGAKYSTTIGDNELDSGKAVLKNMITGEKSEIDITADICTLIKATE